MSPLSLYPRHCYNTSMKIIKRAAIHRERIGSPDLEVHLRQSLANVKLEGLTPNRNALQVVRSMAHGDTTPDAAIAEIRSWYVRRA